MVINIFNELKIKTQSKFAYFYDVARNFNN